MSSPAPRRSQPSGLRCELLGAARQVLVDVGSAALSVRAVARSVGVSHQATKHHFGDRAGLLTAMAASGFDDLTAALDRATARSRSATDRVAVIGITYVRFARSNRALFALMFDDLALHATDDSLVAARLATWTRLNDAVTAAAADGWGGGVSATELTIAAWSVAHGIATLEPGPLGAITDERGTEQVLRLATAALAQATEPPASGARRP